MIVQLVASCVVLGFGIALILSAGMGSDGYSTLIRGLSLALHLDFSLVNIAVGAILVALAWMRGVRPGIGTIVQPVVVGAVASVLLHVVPEPSGLLARVGLLLISLPIIALGVAGYLATRTGAGPTEAAALALDPPIPFRWSYGFVQGAGTLIGWLTGAAVGPGTVVGIFLLGPMIDLLSKTMYQRPTYRSTASKARRAPHESVRKARSHFSTVSNQESCRDS